MLSEVYGQVHVNSDATTQLRNRAKARQCEDDDDDDDDDDDNGGGDDNDDDDWKQHHGDNDFYPQNNNINVIPIADHSSKPHNHKSFLKSNFLATVGNPPHLVGVHFEFRIKSKTTGTCCESKRATINFLKRLPEK
ncbi:hypothetical protein RUM44_005780 [Polyplax serrata]|uniref:Uncharacterized protein n=1 Tax=Polyplax serrata TaxID=468196 RepID=A0ABR1AY16_POLSC